MQKITLLTDHSVNNVLVPENRTIRQVLIDNHIDYEGGTVYVNALPIQMDGLDAKFSYFSDDPNHHYIEVKKEKKKARNISVNTPNGPKIYIIGTVCIIVSALTLQEIMDTKANSPEFMQLLNEKGEAYFAMDTEDGDGSINEYGAVYGNSTTKEGKATITLLLNSAKDDRISLVGKQLYHPLKLLVKLENQILKQYMSSEAESISDCQIIEL